MGYQQAGGSWRPYVAGALVGLLAIVSAFATTKMLGKTTYLGTSTTFVRAAAMIEREFLPERVAKNAYFQKETVKVDWQFMLVCGIFVGALLGALTGGAFEWESVPSIWARHFGHSLLQRGVWAFVGGTVAMFGARLADGCPSGHGLSGVMQLSASGVAALLCFFAGGVLVAGPLYRKGNDDE
ncbi:MAG: YeeE/YedE thiosulfate transporter family protein [bacterium]